MPMRLHGFLWPSIAHDSLLLRQYISRKQRVAMVRRNAFCFDKTLLGADSKSTPSTPVRSEQGRAA
jgi:hypothetical protein